MKISLSLALAFFIGCAGDQTGSQRELDIELEKLLNSDRAFSQTSKAQGAAEAFRHYLLEDAFQLPNGGALIKSRSAIVENLREGGSYSLEWNPVGAGVAGARDFGYTWGHYTFRTSASGKTIVREGKYLNIWKKDSTGVWKVLIDMGNSGI